MPVPPGQSVVQLRIGLKDITPTIWRRLLVPGSVRLAKLHLMFQAAMGWTDSHLHDFRIGDKVYGSQFDDYPDDELRDRDVTVVAAVRGERRFVYQYDFGDSWEHEVVVEEVTTSPFGLKFAVCLDGQNSCPPEDCGGYPGYELRSRRWAMSPMRSTTAMCSGWAARLIPRRSVWPPPTPLCSG